MKLSADWWDCVKNAELFLFTGENFSMAANFLIMPCLIFFQSAPDFDLQLSWKKLGNETRQHLPNYIRISAIQVSENPWKLFSNIHNVFFMYCVLKSMVCGCRYIGISNKIPTENHRDSIPADTLHFLRCIILTGLVGKKWTPPFGQELGLPSRLLYNFDMFFSF